jgi:thiol-disulfide isomerase/thioredoxin
MIEAGNFCGGRKRKDPMLSLPAALVAMAITGSGPGPALSNEQTGVLLDFYADWCGPCQSMNPTVEQLAARGRPVRRVNVDQHRDLAQRFNIRSIPCFVMIVNGREAGRVVGPTSLARLEQLCSLGRAAAPNPNTMLAMPARAAPAAAVINPGAAATAPSTPGPQFVPAVYNVTVQQPPATDSAMLAASVRIRVEDPQGHSCGSGTIIDARAGGEALVVTCGHLFRDSQGAGKIEVDVYGPSPAARVPGRLIAYDLDRDVALIAFRPTGPVMVARVAPPGYTIREGDAVTSVGCNNGEDPTVQHSRVTSVDRFRDAVAQRNGLDPRAPHAPWNLQISGQPVVGRSGGGLFTSEGLVIGVCNAAVPDDHEGLFAAVGSIHAALDQKKLDSLYKQPIAPPAMVPPIDSAPAAGLIAVDPFSAGRSAEPRTRIVSQAPSAGPGAVAAGAPATAASRPSAGDGATTSNDQAAMAEISRRLRSGSEIVCVIRDPSNPQAKSEVITLNRSEPVAAHQSPSVERPYNEPPGPGEPQPLLTSMEVPKRPAPILEWDVNTGWKHRQPLP